MLTGLFQTNGSAIQLHERMRIAPVAQQGKLFVIND